MPLKDIKNAIFLAHIEILQRSVEVKWYIASETNVDFAPYLKK